MKVFFITMWTVYILYSVKRDRYYIGYTGDELTVRIRKHNTNHKGFTGGAGDWELKYIEVFGDKLSAHRRELQIKGWKSRIKLESLISGSGHSGF